MGKHSRSHQEQHRTIRRNQNIVRGGAAVLALAAASFVVAEQQHGGTESPAPKDVTELVQSASKQHKDGKVAEVLKHDYKQVASRKIGGIRVRIAEIGKPEAMDYEKLLGVYQSLGNFLQTQPAEGLHPMVTYDSNNAITDDMNISVRPMPLHKDITVFAVPASIDIGSYQGVPDVFTSTKPQEAVSFIRPDMPFAFEGAITEACQGMVSVEIGNPELIAPNKLDKVQLLAQEQFCNSLARAMSASLRGASFQDFQTREAAGGGRLFTDQIAPKGSFGYASAMPYVGDPTVYKSLGGGSIPSYFEQSLEFPSIATAG